MSYLFLSNRDRVSKISGITALTRERQHPGPSTISESQQAQRCGPLYEVAGPRSQEIRANSKWKLRSTSRATIDNGWKKQALSCQGAGLSSQLNPWPKDRKLKELRMWEITNFLEGLERFSMTPFTKVLGWSRAELDVFLVDVRKDIKPQDSCLFRLFCCHGQKPPQKQ